MSEPLRNRQAEVEREFRKLARREAWETWLGPLCVGLVVIPFVLAGCYTFPVTARIIGATVSAIGIPIMMWMDRRK
jgi:hypothetical protein